MYLMEQCMYLMEQCMYLMEQCMYLMEQCMCDYGVYLYSISRNDTKMKWWNTRDVYMCTCVHVYVRMYWR